LINCTSDTVLRFLPPFILQKEHVDQAIAALDEILKEHANGTAVGNTQRSGQPRRGTMFVASRAFVERQMAAIPVEQDQDILTAAARLAGEDMCSINDLSSAETSGQL
jgi:hypothetical protein